MVTLNYLHFFFKCVACHMVVALYSDRKKTVNKLEIFNNTS